MPGDPVGIQQADPLADALATLTARVDAMEKTGQFWPGFIGYTGGSVAPAGWLVADGSTYDTDRYAALFAVLGTNTLPNLIDCFPVGAGNLYTLLANGGAASVTLTAAQSGVPAHAHPAGTTGAGSAHTHTATTGGGTAHQHAIPVATAAGGSAGNFVPPSNVTASGGNANVNAESAHTHAITVNTESAHTHSFTTPNSVAANAASAHSVLNPYCALTPLIHV